MADLLLLTPASGGSAQVLPALGLLSHRVRVLPVEPSALVDAPDADIVVLDARRDLVTARTTCRLLRATGLTVPLILVLTEGGLTVVTAEWGADDISGPRGRERPGGTPSLPTSPPSVGSGRRVGTG